jgi:hypothetical protein
MEDLTARARSLINLYGDEAAEVAKARSLRFRALGDFVEAVLWERVMDTARDLLACGSDLPVQHAQAHESPASTVSG